MSEGSGFQEALTRDVLIEMDVMAFTFQMGDQPNKGCMMIHSDGMQGYITLADASSRKYPIYDYETEKLIDNCGSVAEVIRNGWTVST